MNNFKNYWNLTMYDLKQEIIKLEAERDYILRDLYEERDTGHLTFQQFKENYLRFYRG